MSTLCRSFRFLAVLVLWLGVSIQPATAAEPPPPNPPLPIAPVFSFVHTVTSANIDPAYAYISYLDHAYLNDPTYGSFYNLLVTPNFNPRGKYLGVYNNHPIAVWYNSTLGRWAVVNQDGGAMTVGASFNVMFFYNNSNGFCHTSMGFNTSDDYSVMDFSFINGRQGAFLIMTQVLSFSATPPSLYNHNVGVAYDGVTGRWRIYNEDETDMETGRFFCGMDFSPYQNAWRHNTFTSGPNLNCSGNYTWLDIPPATNRNELIFTTHFIGIVSFPYFSNHPLGVWYDSSRYSGSWSIFNQDGAAMRHLDMYNVFAITLHEIYLPLTVR